MTTLVAWVAVDARMPSTLYLASDSRITWRPGSSFWDGGRKLFASRTFPDVFGYAGDVVAASIVLGQVVEALDHGALAVDADNAEARHAKVIDAFRLSLDLRHRAPDYDFTILHGARDGWGMSSRFHLWQCQYRASAKSLADSAVDLAVSSSSVVARLGSGRDAMGIADGLWRKSELGRTSRGVFSALCDVIENGEDEATGGAPQLVALYLKGSGRTLGTYHNGTHCFNGLPLPDVSLSNEVEWRDRLFQRIDPTTGQILRGAQRHARPHGV